VIWQKTSLQRSKAEIQRVLEKFGVKFLGPDERDPKGKKVIKLQLEYTSQVNWLLERRGTGIHLLCTIGSWRDTATDEFPGKRTD
jgi:hypothetical protein